MSNLSNFNYLKLKSALVEFLSQSEPSTKEFSIGSDLKI